MADQDQPQKVYCGNGKVIKTQYGDLMKLSLHPDDIQKLVDRSKETKDSGGWVNLAVKERREPSEKGMTHYLEIDTWKPNSEHANNSNQNNSTQDNSAKAQDEEKELSAEDLPF